MACWIFSDLIGSAASAPTPFAVGVKLFAGLACLFSIVLLLLPEALACRSGANSGKNEKQKLDPADHLRGHGERLGVKSGWFC